MRDASALARLVAPASIVLVGPSPRHPLPVANATAGRSAVYGLHPRRSEVLGVPCVPDWERLPDGIDAALILVGHERAECAVADALAAGVRSLAVPGLGAEAGAEGRKTAKRIRDQAREADVPLLGVNCMGIAVPGAASLWIGGLASTFHPGHVAAIVQSGSVGEALVAVGPRVGFRAVVSCGAETTTGAADFLSFFAADPGTQAVALFLETVRDPGAFGHALAAAGTAGKPVVCVKVGRSETAARAALAHTGAIVGSDRSFDALLDRYGAIRADDLADLVETLEVLGRRRRPRGTSIVGVSESGGEAALFADHAEAAGLRLPVLSDAVREHLQSEFPNFVSPENPLDAWAVDEPERVYPASLEILAASTECDVLFAQVDLSRFRDPADQEWNELIVRALLDSAKRHDRFPAVVTSHTSDPPIWATDLARDEDLALLRGSGNAAKALARAALCRPRAPAAPAAGEQVAIDDLTSAGGALPEHESAEILERYGVAFAPRRRVSTASAAAEAAAELGYPVVVKSDGPAHKARIGGVTLDLTTAAEVAEAARELGGRALVAKQLEADEELLCGMTRDAYGPVLVLGRGGRDVERDHRSAVALGPLDDGLARELIERAGLDRFADGLVPVVLAVSRLAEQHAGIAEVDINPLLATPAGLTAVDALVVLETKGASE